MRGLRRFFTTAAMWAQVCACPSMVAPWQELAAVLLEPGWQAVLLELLYFLVGLYVIWLGLQMCGEFGFVVLAVARCYWQLSLEMQ